MKPALVGTCQHGVGEAPNTLATAHEGGQNSHVTVPAKSVTVGQCGTGMEVTCGRDGEGLQKNFNFFRSEKGLGNVTRCKGGWKRTCNAVQLLRDVRAGWEGKGEDGWGSRGAGGREEVGGRRLRPQSGFLKAVHVQDVTI